MLKETKNPTTYIIYHFERLIPIDPVYLCIYVLTEVCKETNLQIYAYKDCCPHAWQSVFHLVPIPGDQWITWESQIPLLHKSQFPWNKWDFVIWGAYWENLNALQAQKPTHRRGKKKKTAQKKKKKVAFLWYNFFDHPNISWSTVLV